MRQTPEPTAEGLYRPRSSEYVDHYVDILTSPPDRELNAEEKEVFLRFENGLMDGMLADRNDIAASTGRSLDELIDETAYSKDWAELSLDYFETEDGRQALKAIGVIDSPSQDPIELARQIRSVALSASPETLKQMQVDSEEYSDSLLAAAIAQDQIPEVPPRIRVFTDGSKLMQRAVGLRAYKSFFREVSRELSFQADEHDNLLAAEQAVLRMYRRKVNALLATLEPNFLEYWRQLQDLDEGVHKKVLIQSAKMAWPALERVDTDKDSVAMRRFTVRLDRIRNGASQDEQGRYTAISRDLEAMFSKPDLPEAYTAEPLFSPEEIEQLDTIKFDAGQMQSFCKFLLAHFDKLSSEPDETYSPDRPVRAADGKWQVPVRGDVKAMSAEDPPGALAVPAKFKRGLTKKTPPVGVIPGALHEIKHIFQNDNYRNNTRGMKLGQAIKGNGNLVLREAGALDVERQAQGRLFGRDRPINPQHIAAIKVLEQGGSEVSAAIAFYNTYLEQNPDASREAAAEAAVRGVKRTARRQGGFDTQSLDYAESALIFNSASSLPEEARNVIFGEGSFSLSDLAELYRFGLVQTGEIEPFPIDEMLSLSVEYMKEILAKNLDK